MMLSQLKYTSIEVNVAIVFEKPILLIKIIMDFSGRVSTERVFGIYQAHFFKTVLIYWQMKLRTFLILAFLALTLS